MQCACRDQAIVAADKLNNLCLIETVTLHRERIDDDLHQFLARTNEVDFKYPTQPLDFFFQVLGQLGQCSFRNITCEVQHQHWVEARHLYFIDCRFISFARQLGLRLVDFFTDILQCLVCIYAGIKLELHIGTAFISVGGHFLYAFNRPQFLLHRADQQAFCIFRRNAVMRDADIDNRNFNIGFGFFGDGAIRHQPADQHH